MTSSNVAGHINDSSTIGSTMTSVRSGKSQPDFRNLRTLAGEGDLVAITALIDLALEHKAIYSEIVGTHLTLTLTLKADRVPDPRVTSMLVCREVEQWPHFSTTFEILVLEGQAFCDSSAEWIYKFAIAPSDQIPTIHQAAAGSLWVALPSAPLSMERGLSVQPMDVLGWRAIASGLFLATLVLASQQVTFLLSPLITLVHELGHTCLSWMFGYPAIPAFDFINGGGVTMHSNERINIIVGLIYTAFGYFFYRYWHNHLTARILLAIALCYTLYAFTPLHEILILFMGHGSELIFSGIFLYRAMSGAGCRYSIERPLYAMLGFYLVAYDVRFTIGLLFDADIRDRYLQGKGGVLDNDLVRIAGEYLKTDLSVVVVLLLGCTLLAPAIAFLLYRYRPLVSSGFTACSE
jgi:hypothetical protein